MNKLKSFILFILQPIVFAYVYHDQKGCLCECVNETITYCANEKGQSCVNFPRNVDVKTPELEIINTDIHTIKTDDLKSLAKLQILTFYQNYQLRTIELNAFQSLISLTTIQFKYNPKLAVLSSGVFNGLTNLRTLIISGNRFRDIDRLMEAIKTTDMPQLNTLELSEEKFSNLANHTFMSMQNSTLRDLTLHQCEIGYMQAGTFKPLKELKILRIGDNRFDEDNLVNVLNETINSGVDLELLDISSVTFCNGVPIELQQIIAHSNITQINLSGNHFDSINETFFSVLLPNLKILDLTDVELRNMDNALINAPNLEELSLEKNRLTAVPPGMNLSCLKYLNIMHNTETYQWQFNLEKEKFFRMTSLERLDLGYTRLWTLSSQSFGSIRSLRELNLGNCSLIFIQPDTFSGLGNLRYLNLENNNLFQVSPDQKLGISINPDTTYLSKVEIFKFGGNNVKSLNSVWKNMLMFMKNIKHLFLENNNIENISPDKFSLINKLETLDISNNFLNHWEDRIFANTNLTNFFVQNNEITYISDAMVKDFQNLKLLELKPNPFLCDCNMLINSGNIKKILHLIQNEAPFCVQPPGITLNNFIQNSEKFESELECQGTFYDFNLIYIAIVVVVLLISGFLIYLCRWRLRYQIFLLKHCLYRQTFAVFNLMGAYKDDYKYDAFVSYCSKDQNFVAKLVDNLENSQPSIKMCVFERDFQIGTVISDSVLENIAKSRKTILIISNAYARSYWCTWESHIARHYKLFNENSRNEKIQNSIILIKLESISEENLNPTLKYLFGTRIYLQWSEEVIKQKVFWMQLKELLRVDNKKYALKNDSVC